MKELPLFPQGDLVFPRKSLGDKVGLDEQGLDLLDKMLQCNPAHRITAKQALLHPYLKEVPDSIRKMK